MIIFKLDDSPFKWDDSLQIGLILLLVELLFSNWDDSPYKGGDYLQNWDHSAYSGMIVFNCG